MSYSYADNVSEHSYFSSASSERHGSRNQNGGGYYSRSYGRGSWSQPKPQFFAPRRITLSSYSSRNGNADERTASYATPLEKPVLNSPIQFVPAKRPFETDSTELKSKYVCITGKLSTDRANSNGQAEGIRAYPTKSGLPKLLNGNGSVNGGTSSEDSSAPTENGSSSATGVPPPAFEIFPADGVHLQWDPSLRCSTSVGLNNLGNTCFLNSILQVLSNTAPLVNYLLNNEHDTQKCPTAISCFCALCLMRNHISRSRGCTNHGQESFSPTAVVNRIRTFMKSHTVGRQEDAHEFLRYFIDAMQTAALYPYKDQKLDLFTKETSIISRIFGGYHKNEIICNNCHSSSVTYDPFLDLNVEIKQSNSLEAALSHFTSVETLASDNAYLCPKCNRRVSARKMFTIFQPPNVLTIQLKRFDHFGKIDRLITYPERLNLRQYMTDKHGQPIMYKLYGIVVHLGRTTHSGHYYSFIRDPFDQWFVMDDSRVVPVPPNTALRNAGAYLLFYIRLSTPVASVKPQTKPQSGFIGPQHPPVAPSSPLEVSSPSPAPPPPTPPTQVVTPTSSPLPSPKTPETPKPNLLSTPAGIVRPGFRLTFSAVPVSPVLGRSPRMAVAEPTRKPPATPIVGKFIPVQGSIRPLKFRVFKPVVTATAPIKAETTSLRPKTISTTPIIVKAPKPIQDSRVSSSTKLVPYDDDDDDDEAS